jgi:hypothetical protein
VPLYRRLLELYPQPASSLTGSPAVADLASWHDALAQGLIALGDTAAALEAYRAAVRLEPQAVAPLEKLARLAAESAPDESIAAWHKLLELSPAAEPLHALVKLFQKKEQPDPAFVAAAILVALGEATPEETALHDAVAKLPPAAGLPALGELDLRASDDSGPLRELLAGASAELARAFPTPLAGRAERVKGDNPVRRVCAALARALGLAEPAMYLSKSEPGLVAPAAAVPPGLIVGAEAPRRYAPRVQRFLYSRALAHVKFGTHTLVDQLHSAAPGVGVAPPAQGVPAARLTALGVELCRLCAPAGSDLSKLPAHDPALEGPLAAALAPEERTRLSPAAAALLAALPLDPAPLALAIRESAERVAMILCGDPAAALGVVLQECPGGLARPEVARLARFALSPNYLALRAR